MIFPAVADAVPDIYDSGTTELYAADIALAPPAGEFTATSLTVVEGIGPASVEVRLARAASVVATVSYSVTGGTAAAGVDFTLGAGPLTFAPGETVKTLPLTYSVL